MAHSHLNKRKAFAFIADEIGAGRQPTDAQIMDLCDFRGVELSRTLLADLADEGAIAISYSGEDRRIALGRKEATKIGPSPVPIRSIVKPAHLAPSIGEDAGAARIMAIVNGGARPQAKSQMPERQRVETVEAQQEGPMTRSPPPASVDQGPEPERPPSQAAEEAAKRDAEPPQAVEARQPIARPDLQIVGGRRQLSFSVPEAVYLAVSDRAADNDGSTAGVARTIFLDAFDAERCDTGRRHKLSAGVVRGWRDDPSGLTLDGFVTGLIELGLRELQRYAGHAEAAE